ncbi:MAG: hypothetical protein ABI241_00445 [Bacteroidia bacterium]
MTAYTINFSNVAKASDLTQEIADRAAGDTALSNSKLSKNSAITAATKTKITYDANGLVTGGSDATTADIAASTDKNYITDAKQVVLGNTSGTNTGDQIISDATISTTDITTNNVSTTKHGFAPKLPNDDTKYLDGKGNYTTPPGGGSSLTYSADAALTGATTINLNGIGTAHRTLSGNATITISGMVNGDEKTIVIKQHASVAYTVSWANAGFTYDIAKVQTTQFGKKDWYTLKMAEGVISIFQNSWTS